MNTPEENYIIKFNNLPLGTYDLSIGISDNIVENNYWTEPENKITNEFDDDFEDADFSLAVWSPTKGNWHIHTGSNNYLWTTSPAPAGYDPIAQMRGTSNWTDYTVEVDIAFIYPGTDGSAAHAYILGRDSMIMRALSKNLVIVKLSSLPSNVFSSVASNQKTMKMTNAVEKNGYFS